ncbi:hypothetical protein HLB27_03450 [Dickeya dadantii]|uniref:hypothetical protein n=1 Tax=Dickeya dadantii TaxID=204038 RepID=UPI00149556FF|nr:hypothetical protein [Dickeya dadantii]NPE57704.1 hypothetical protein [Dickeya dadantii]NPE69822.1 hypothetical protein [Dickeya dadantii]
MSSKPISEHSAETALRLEVERERRTPRVELLKEKLAAAESHIAALEQQLAAERARNVTNAIRAFVTGDDIKGLNRFAECCDDPDSGGHDLEKEQVTRLEKIGALQRSGRISYITDFGDLVLSLRIPTEGE